MKIVKTAGTILLLASVNAFSFEGKAFNQLDGLFTGSGRVETGSFIPEAAPEPQTAPVAALQVMADIKVPQVPNSRAFLEIALNKLSKVYGFKLDETFEPKLHGEGGVREILSETSYLVRGVLAADKLAAFKADNVVKAVYENMEVHGFASADAGTLQRFIDAHEFDLLAVRGVKGVVLGTDCPIQGPHQHVLPHHPAIVIYVAGDDAAVRAAVLKALPELSALPYRLAPVSESVELTSVRCLIPEGCAN